MHPTRLRTSRSQSLNTFANKFWLDALPLDAAERIAVYVCHGRPNATALALAQTSSQQQQAVAKAVHFTYCSRDFDGVRNALEWAEVLSPFVVDVHFDDSLYAPLKRLSTTANSVKLFKLFLSPKLQSWTVSTSMLWLLNKLAEKSWADVRSHLQLDAQMHTENDMLRIIKAVSPARLTLLNIDSELSNLTLFSEEVEKAKLGIYTESFSGVQSLNLGRHPGDEVVSRMREIVSCPMTALVEGRLAENDITTLQILHNVKVCFPAGKEISSEDDLLNTAELLGCAVTEIQDAFCFYPDVIADLATSCPNLRKLDLVLDRGEEGLLAEALQKVSSLRSLQLQFMSTFLEENAYRTNLGAILSIVKSCNHLEELFIHRAYVYDDELIQIFQVLGQRLKRFEMSARDNGEECYESLYQAVAAAKKYSPQLCNVHVSAPGVCANLNTDESQWRSSPRFPFPRKKAKRSAHGLLGRALVKRVEEISAFPPLLAEYSGAWSDRGMFSLELSVNESTCESA